MTIIAVIDDRVTNRRILGKLAQTLDADALIKTFEDPVDALEWTRDNPPDLVITDFKMPRMDGAAFTKGFRDLPQCYDVPVMVVTAIEDRDFRYRALEAGATDFLLSPVDHREFTVRARNLLTLSKQQQQIRQRALALEEKIRSDDRQHREEMQRRREQLLSVIDVVPAMISATDERGRCRFMNRYQADCLGIAPDDAVGRPAVTLVGGNYRANTVELDREIFSSGESPPPYEEEFLDRNGGTRILLTTKRPLTRPDGGVSHVVTVSLDITERKRMEEQLRAANEEAVAAREFAEAACEQAELSDRAKSEFLASMSHELRTPLNAIIGFSEMMLSEAYGPLGDQHYRGYTSDIHKSGEHLLKIIGDILDLSTVEMGHLELTETDIDVPSMLDDVRRLAEMRGRGSGVRIETCLVDGLPPLRADEIRVKQVLLHLLSNAVKYSADSGRVRLEAVETETGGLQIRIIDNGRGMSPAQLKQATNGETPRSSKLRDPDQGAGLGLALSQRLLGLHGASVHLESIEGRGTTATILFPAERLNRAPRGGTAPRA